MEIACLKVNKRSFGSSKICNDCLTKIVNGSYVQLGSGKEGESHVRCTKSFVVRQERCLRLDAALVLREKKSLIHKISLDILRKPQCGGGLCECQPAKNCYQSAAH